MSRTPKTQSPALRHRTAGYLAGIASLSLLATTLSSPAVAQNTPTVTPAPEIAGPQTFDAGRYTVMLKQAPVASYEGELANYPRTRPKVGQRLDSESENAKKYSSFLLAEQRKLAGQYQLKIDTPTATVLNGFTADLTAEQALLLSVDPRVDRVLKDEIVTVDTVSTPEYLKLSEGNGAWRKYGIPRRAGEGVVVGVIDSGISSTNASFAGRKMPTGAQTRVNKPWMTTDGTTHMLKSDGNKFTGECQVSAGWTLADCNDKLISARYYGENYWKNTGKENIHPNDSFSPRDNSGHGSHTAGTAVGNFGVPMVVNGESKGRGSGMAPAAKLAVYKVCWDAKEKSGCSVADVILAIDDAVKDGVDVINFSVSGSRASALAGSGVAFLNAAAAGVFVAAAGGNSGPKKSTVANVSPWVTTVAAAAHAYTEGTVTDGAGGSYLGSSAITEPFPETPAVQSRNIPADGKTADEAGLCLEGSLDAAAAAGKIVVCERGEIARTAKSDEAKRAGAVGFVLRNMSPNSIAADNHAVPGVHLDKAPGDRLVKYLENTENPTLALAPGNTTGGPGLPVPEVATFSSRGPALVNKGNLLKPDIAAPGVDVMAAVDEHRDSGDFGTMSGTSMATPHIAGLAALIYGKHPLWSPMTIKSAMMTTSNPLLAKDRSEDQNNFNTGSGLVNPSKFYEPGLVYDSGVRDWFGYAEFVTGQDFDGIDPIRTIDLNLPSMAMNSVVGKEVITRRVRAMQPGTFTATAQMPGFDIQVSPSTLTFDKAGEEKSFTITVRRTTAQMFKYQHGSLTWQGPGNDVVSPMVARPEPSRVPTSVVLDTAAGKTTYEAVSGTDAQIPLQLSQFVPASVQSDGTIVQGPISLFGENDSNKHFEFEIPEGTAATRVEVLAGEGTDRVDVLIKEKDSFRFIPSLLAGLTSQRSKIIDIRDANPGKYVIIVNGALVPADEGKYSLRVYNVPTPTDTSNVTITPKVWDAKAGETQKFVVEHSGLDSSVPHFGYVDYLNTGDRTYFSTK